MAETTLFATKEEAKTSLTAVYRGLKNYFDVHRTSTELYFLERIRLTHPHFFVVCTGRVQGHDLLGFAAAGHATITRDEDEYLTDASRSYVGPSSRMDPSPGCLVNTYRFTRYQYRWNDKLFLVYGIEYLETSYRATIKLDFILAPKSPETTKEGEKSNIDKLLMAVGSWGSQLHNEIYVFDLQRWTKDKELWKSVKGSSWDDVILEPNMKENLIKDVQGFFDNQQLYKSLSVPWKRGLILHGIPGNGKTISIKALINSLSERTDPVPSLYVKNFDSCSGEKYAINEIFRKARRMAPCLLIFEDLDSLVKDETRSYFLNEVDGLESNDGILMLGSTNHLDRLDPAISKRPSRFDRKYSFRLPGEAERVAYCQFWRRKLVDNDLVEFQEELSPVIAKLTDGFSFAYLKELFVIALLTIARSKSDEQLEQLNSEQNSGSVGESSEDAAPKSEDGESVVVVDPVDDIESSTAKEVGSTAEPTAKVEPPKKKRVMPQIEIEDSLKESRFLRVVVEQISILLEEMDNTAEDPRPRPAEKVKKSYRPLQRTTMARVITPIPYDVAYD